MDVLFIILLLALLLAAISAKFRVSVRRDDAAVCGACGYDLRGLPSQTKCPECGSDIRGRISRSLVVSCNGPALIGIALLSALSLSAVVLLEAVWRTLFLIQWPGFVPSPTGFRSRFDATGFMFSTWLVWTVGFAVAVRVFDRYPRRVIAISLLLAPALLVVSTLIEWNGSMGYWHGNELSIILRMAACEVALLLLAGFLRAYRSSRRLR